MLLLHVIRLESLNYNFVGLKIGRKINDFSPTETYMEISSTKNYITLLNFQFYLSVSCKQDIYTKVLSSMVDDQQKDQEFIVL